MLHKVIYIYTLQNTQLLSGSLSWASQQPGGPQRAQQIPGSFCFHVILSSVGDKDHSKLAVFGLCFFHCLCKY